MILKRYGTTVQSVEPNFNSRALTEIAFRRDQAFSIPAEEFETSYEKVTEHSLTAETEGEIHDEAEEALLGALEEKVEALVSELGEGQVLVVESRDGEDHAKTRNTKKNVVVDGENRFYFFCQVHPPLRVGVYRKR
jgi:hypothetical protein